MYRSSSENSSPAGVWGEARVGRDVKGWRGAGTWEVTGSRARGGNTPADLWGSRFELLAGGYSLTWVAAEGQFPGGDALELLQVQLVVLEDAQHGHEVIPEVRRQYACESQLGIWHPVPRCDEEHGTRQLGSCDVPKPTAHAGSTRIKFASSTTTAARMNLHRVDCMCSVLTKWNGRKRSLTDPPSP